MLAIASTIITIPALIISAGISKLYSAISGNYPLDVSRTSFIREISNYTKTTVNLRITSKWINGIHVLCKYATVFSGLPPIIIIHGTGSCSFNYAEFMDTFPNTYDVYCIDLPGWGISRGNAPDINYFGRVIMGVASTLHPHTKITFVGHSFGAFILLKSIESNVIHADKIHKCVLVSMPGTLSSGWLRSYFWGPCFIFGIFEWPCKQWWSRYLFRAFLYRQSTPLDTLKRMYRFIPDGDSYKHIGNQMVYRYPFPSIWRNTVSAVSLGNVAKQVPVEVAFGLCDTIVDIWHTRDICKVCKSVKLHELEYGGHSVFSQPTLFSQLLRIIDDEMPYKVQTLKSRNKK